MFLEDCTYCGRPATFKLNGLDRVDNNLHYVPADNGVMLQQLYQAESGRVTFLRRCHPYHLNIGR
jgi:hypothetical protein